MNDPITTTPAPSGARPPRPWIRWVRMLAGVALLGLLLAKADFASLSVRFSGLLALGALAAVACLAAAQGLSALRWRVLLGPDAAPWSFLYRLYLIAAFFSLFLPTAVGGDAVRAAAASHSLGRPSRMVATVLVDRMLGVLALAAFLVLGLVVTGGGSKIGLGWHLRPRLLAAIGGGFLLLAGIGYLARRRLAKPLGFVMATWQTYGELAREPGRLAGAVLLGFAVQGAYLLAWIAVAAGLGLRLPASSFLLTVPIVSLSAMAPITLSGVGVREGAWILLLAPYGIKSADALALSLTYFACWMLVAGVGGILFAARGLRPAGASSPGGSTPEASPAPPT